MRVRSRAETFHRALLDPFSDSLASVFARRLDFRLIRLLLRGAKAAVCHPLLVLTTRDDKVVIFAVAPPRPRWHVTNFDELPIGHVGWRQSQVIAHCG